MQSVGALTSATGLRRESIVCHPRSHRNVVLFYCYRRFKSYRARERSYANRHPRLRGMTAL